MTRFAHPSGPAGHSGRLRPGRSDLLDQLQHRTGHRTSAPTTPCCGSPTSSRSAAGKNAELDSSAAAVRAPGRRASPTRQRRQHRGPRSATRAWSGTPAPRRCPDQALTVTLTDAPPNATAQVPGVPEPQPNDLVIHQQDLQAVVNALWEGGAEGIQVMDQRLISTSAVRCVGNTLILQGRVYSPPYKVTAVGDQEALQQGPGRLPGHPELPPVRRRLRPRLEGRRPQVRDRPARLLGHRRPAARRARRSDRARPGRTSPSDAPHRAAAPYSGGRAPVAADGDDGSDTREDGTRRCTAGSGGICRATRGCGR